MKIAMLQICSKLDYKRNLKKISEMIKEAKHSCPDVEAIILPEVFYSMSDGQTPTPHLIEGENEHFINIQDLARKNNIALLGGSAATRVNHNIYNRSYNFDANGSLLKTYDKTHLFKIELKGTDKEVIIDEGKTYSRGEDLAVFDFAGINLGISICFDLRFPELYRKLFSMGANAFLVSSAFTQTTGRAHWETLLRARAIENQSYVIACNQWGKHNDKLTSYGHSMVINPWGEIVASAKEGEEIIFADIDLALIKKIRSRMLMKRQLAT